MKALKERVEELEIRLYQGAVDEDILIAQWWYPLGDELPKLVSSSAYSLSGFYNLFKPPNMMSYTVKDKEMESVHWAEPVSTSPHAIFFSSWSSEELRGTKRHATLMTTIYEIIFNMGKKTILGITKQESLLDLHKKLGYVIMGPVPYLFDDDEAWIMYLTEPMFKDSRVFAVANKISNKE